MALKIDCSVVGETTCLKLTGIVDEQSNFPDMGEIKGAVSIDLGQVSSINSVGIRNWLVWFSTFDASASFVFQNCPVPVVMQMNMVEGFLPAGAVVESFFVPYYCESCDDEIRKNSKNGKDIILVGGKAEIKSPGHDKCEKGCELELDVNENKYFRFLVKSALSDQKAA